MSGLTYFEAKVAEALAAAQPATLAGDFLEQWSRDMRSIARVLDAERDGFDPTEFVLACGGMA